MTKHKSYEKLRAQTIARAWKDPRFKEKLLKNPKAALQEMGWDLSQQLHVHAVEDKQNTFTFVLPPSIAHADELSERDLEQLAAGVTGGCGTNSPTVCKACPPPTVGCRPLG
ncbi:MAG: NHLP leader peptide family RiPP precursor [Chlamydiales bacterium]